jgi:Diacylglycerol acyltransferase
VPVFSFGEVDILNQPSNEPGSLMRAYQEFVKKWTGIAPAFAYGRGITENTIGMIPYRHPINTVIGAPIDVKQNPNPSDEEIDELHKKYAFELEKLFEEHKVNYVQNYTQAKLVFV